MRQKLDLFVKKEDVFRYNNFPGHPGVLPPYHHKHLPGQEAIHLNEAPKLIDVIEEAIRYMF